MIIKLRYWFKYLDHVDVQLVHITSISDKTSALVRDCMLTKILRQMLVLSLSTVVQSNDARLAWNLSRLATLQRSGTGDVRGEK